MLNAILAWFHERIGFGPWRRRLADAPVAGGACWCKVWPAAIAFAFCVQAITGFFLWCYYSPSRQTAWESVYFLQTDVAGGQLLRAIHHYTAHVLLAMLIIYVAQSILTRACRPPRELVFWAAVGLGLFALAAFLTGDLLAFDQQGYYATKTRTGFLNLLPWIGGGLHRVAIGGPGPELGNLALTRFFALHVGVFSGGFLALLAVHGILARRADAARAAAAPQRAEPYWPRQAWRNGVACAAVMAVVLWICSGVVFHGGAPLLSPADPSETYGAARPEWFLRGVYEFSGRFAGPWQIIPIFIIPGALLAVILAMPFLARRTAGYAFNVIFTLAVLAALVALSWRSVAKDRADGKYLAAVAAEERQARRVFELASDQGIPPLGALELLRNDPKTVGPRLFSEQCASCHDHFAEYGASGNDSGQQIKADKPTAPNLAGFASRAWIAGLLDPKQVAGPRYFGNTKLRSGKMPGFVKETLGELDADEKKSLEKLVMALSAEARLPGHAELDRKDAAAIEEGRKLLSEPFGCTNCHEFRGKGTPGGAPELTGYGSADWIAGIVGDPADKRYYGRLNDRMPAYAPAGNHRQDTLTARQVRLLADWLREDWWEPDYRIEQSEK